MGTSPPRNDGAVAAVVRLVSPLNPTQINYAAFRWIATSRACPGRDSFILASLTQFIDVYRGHLHCRFDPVVSSRTESILQDAGIAGGWDSTSCHFARDECHQWQQYISGIRPTLKLRPGQLRSSVLLHIPILIKGF